MLSGEKAVSLYANAEAPAFQPCAKVAKQMTRR
jgi:hypothetical protein